MSEEILQAFVESTTGQIALIAIIAILLLLVMKFSKSNNVSNVRALTYSALAITIAFVLNQITLFRMPQGGSVTPFSMLFIVLVAYWFGPKQGIMAGMAFGLLDLLINPYVVHPVQLLLDYPFAFGALGLAGFLKDKSNGIYIGYLFGLAGRFICHFLSGVVFFGAWAPEGFNAITWSAVYNGTFLGTEGLLTIILLLLPAMRNAIERVKTNLN